MGLLGAESHAVGGAEGRGERGQELCPQEESLVTLLPDSQARSLLRGLLSAPPPLILLPPPRGRDVSSRVPATETQAHCMFFPKCLMWNQHVLKACGVTRSTL